VDGGSFTSSTTSFPFPTQAVSNTAGSTGNGPKAYLNWLVFDRNYNLILSKSDYARISATPKESRQDVAHDGRRSSVSEGRRLSCWPVPI
jgi:hypothetical protein